MTMFVDYKVLAVGEKFRFGDNGSVYRKLSDKECVNLDVMRYYQIRNDVPTFVIPVKWREYEH